MTLRQEIVQQIETSLLIPQPCSTIAGLLCQENVERNELGSLREFPFLEDLGLRIVQYFHPETPAPASMEEAMERLSARHVLEYILVACFMRFADEHINAEQSMGGDLYDHCLCVGLGAYHLAKEQNRQDIELAFSAGVFHDIGKIFLHKYYPEKQEQISHMAIENNMVVGEAEQMVLGIDHMEIGERILMAWHFPPSLVHVAKSHHVPEQASGDILLVDLVHVADAIALMLGIGMENEGMHYKPSSLVQQRLQLSRPTIEKIASQMLADFETMKDAFRVTESEGENR